MRRTIATLTALATAAALAACSPEEDSTTEDTAAEEVGQDEGAEDEGETDEAEDTAAEDDAAASDDAAGATDEAGATGAAGDINTDDPVCEGFFAGRGTPLAERADAERGKLTAGEDLDPITYSEITLFSGRIDQLVEDGGDHADVLERINAPFHEVIDHVNSEGTRNDETISIPEIDVADSEAAQQELQDACAG